MSKDIRSFFISSKKSSEKKDATENKPRKKVQEIKISDEEDAVHASPSKTKRTKTPDNKKSKSSDKARSKKRTIVSSDEDEEEVINNTKNKKVKVVDDNDHVQRPVEIIVEPENVLNKKPVKRINAVKVNKKIKEEPVKKTTSKSKINFMNKDDDFDATLNQLDTSQIEEEYLAALENEVTSSFFEPKENKTSDTMKKENNISDPKHESNKGKEKDANNLKDKKENLNDKPSSSKKNKNKEKDSELKHENKDKDDINRKHDNDKEKKKGHSNKKLEIEKEFTSHKPSNKAKDIDFNDIIEEKVEKKKHNAVLYQNYLNRGGARNPGSKEIPQGADQCFVNLSFLITGVLDSLEREEAEGIIKQYGGKILHAVSRKLNYIIVGDEPGPSKLAKAESLGIKRISEDGFLDLLRTRPPGPASKKLSTNSDNSNKRKRENSLSIDEHKNPENIKRNKEDSSPQKQQKSPDKMELTKDSSPTHEVEKEISNTENSKIEIKKDDLPVKSKISELSTSKMENKEDKRTQSSVNNVKNQINGGIDHVTALVEKYRPKELKQIIGQTGDKSNARKLQNWLTNWHKNHAKNSKSSKPKYPARDDTGTIYKAALLSGPPGIGKTTTAYVVCAQLGYEVLEFNASDTRSKKLLQEEISGILSNKSVKSFLGNAPNKNKIPPKHVLLMDEVDGMAGNEDRGGMQELIGFIKSTEVPIICICNDRNSQKIRTLANYTFDLRFQKPRLEQIRAAMMSICFKEGIKITPEELTLIIQSTNQDIRQVINHIAVLTAKCEKATSQTESKEKMKYKNLKLGPWDVVRKVFSAEEHKNMTIHDKSDLFFHDYNIAPLFVEENYLSVTPAGSKKELLQKIAKCSESLAIGDIIEKTIRSNQAWSLLPVQACFSSVIPGSVMSGYINSQINFPSWLGRNSKTSKCNRLLQDLTVHTRITTGASKVAINLDYAKILVDSIIRPLAVEGVEGVDEAIDFMNKYHLSREDLDSLIEITKWPHTRDPMQSVDTKTKTAFTKAYNKCALFSSSGTMKKKSSRDTQNEDFIEGEEEEVSDNAEDDEKVENDKLVKAKTSKAKAAPSASKGKAKSTAKNSTRTKKK